MKKIVFISTGQLTLNPRLVKEAMILKAYGYEVTILYQHWSNWAILSDKKIINKFQLETILVGGNSKKNIALYWISRVIFRLIKKLANTSILTTLLSEFALQRTTWLLAKKAMVIKADLYVAHNLGALPVVVIAAKKNNSKCGFDAEDFHRNEATNNAEDYDVKLKSFVEDKYLDKTDYLTTASPLIAEEYKKLYPNLNPIVINNVFEIKDQPPKNLNENKGLKLFWFSQTIGKQRGLEDIIEVLNIINNDNIELHLLGNLSKDDEAYFNTLSKFNIQYYKPVASDKIFSLAAEFDVGLALEPGFSLNNEIALSNKIFTYLISGLAVIASNTQAQQKFLEENWSVGRLYPIGDLGELKKIIIQLLNDKDLLNSYKKNAYYLAQTKYNWELEQKKFLELVKKTLAD